MWADIRHCNNKIKLRIKFSNRIKLPTKACFLFITNALSMYLFSELFTPSAHHKMKLSIIIMLMKPPCTTECGTNAILKAVLTPYSGYD